jgi:hypothetical protein
MSTTGETVWRGHGLCNKIRYWLTAAQARLGKSTPLIRIVPKRPCICRATNKVRRNNVYSVDEAELLVPERHST